ncbi:MAG: TolC family protein [Saprospiraceae bacterium]|nr:TolC family protein [Saprospiraceae bacterium]HMW39404.1 TolC family protein [Saprospiraceae bacterium]HMX88465.1 TolC family protein [Saprospiraceae bacterium]HMZ40354.1 TolC family protein [Saprospiraceae bacterium]HNA65747.1 TolC family protein [Saprospiraceae bacterium]
MKNVIFLGFGLFLIGTVVSAQKSFSLAEAVRYAESNSKSLDLQRLDIQDANDLMTEYRSIGMPKLTGGVGYTHFVDIPTSILPDFISPSVYEVLFKENLLQRRDIDYGKGIPAQFGTKNNLTAKLDFSTLLFDGSFFVGLKAQKMYKELIEKQINQSAADVRYQVTKSYLAASAVEASLQMIDKNIENLSKLTREVSAIYKAGLTENLDVERLELSRQNLDVEREKLVRLYEITKNVLKYQMSYPLKDSITLSQTFDELSRAYYIQTLDPSIRLDISKRPEYSVMDQGRKLAEINIKRYQMSYYPSLSGFASAQRILQRNDLFNGNENKWFPTTLVGLNLNVPIFDGLDRKAKISKAKTLLERTNKQMSEFERGISLAFENAKTQYLNALNTYEARKKTLALAEKIYKTSQVKFKEGVGSSLEVSASERDLYSAQANVLDAQSALIQARVELDKAMGAL